MHYLIKELLARLAELTARNYIAVEAYPADQLLMRFEIFEVSAYGKPANEPRWTIDFPDIEFMLCKNHQEYADIITAKFKKILEGADPSNPIDVPVLDVTERLIEKKS